MAMQSVLDVLQKTESFFGKAGLDRPKIEAEWLLAETLGCKRLELYLQWDRPLDESVLGQLRERVRRRARRCSTCSGIRIFMTFACRLLRASSSPGRRRNFLSSWLSSGWGSLRPRV